MANLDAIHAYIAQNSSRYARRVVENLLNRSEQLAFFPRSGRIVPETQQQEIREVLEGSYQLIYYLKSAEQIDVLAVVHTRQQLRLNDDSE